VNISDVKKMDALDRLVYWITQREWIRVQKSSGSPPPWTDDQILSTYRFCNVRRMDDKVSQWLWKNWYNPHRNHPNMLAAVALARFINLPSSLEGLEPYIFRKGPVSWENMKVKLRAMKGQGQTIFNGAYMVRGNTTKSPDKIGTVIDEYIGALLDLNQGNLAGVINPRSMEETHSRIVPAYGFGSFMAGQIVADLRWAIDGAWLDKKEWAPLGPGSQRGLNRLYGFSAKCSQTQGEFRGMLDETIDTLSQKVPKLISTRLEAMDYQNCLCEYDKYCRALEGEGKPKQLYRGVLR
jgi:hypothetical protein